MIKVFNDKVIEEAKQHALSEYPKESCGFIYEQKYKPLENINDDPTDGFKIDKKKYVSASVGGGLNAVIHSHPSGEDCPSKTDMQTQMETKVPWGIIVLDDRGEHITVKEVFWFGDQYPIAPLLERPFKHGVWDCYNLSRDYYRIKQNLVIKQVARDNEWWHEEEDNEDIFWQNFKEAGFVRIDYEDIRKGDGLLFRVGAPVVNHCAVYVGNGVMLHHLYGRLSRNEPIHRWMKLLISAVRYVE